jgi:hypothetical protein
MKKILFGFILSLGFTLPALAQDLNAQAVPEPVTSPPTRYMPEPGTKYPLTHECFLHPFPNLGTAIGDTINIFGCIDNTNPSSYWYFHYFNQYNFQAVAGQRIRFTLQRGTLPDLLLNIQTATGGGAGLPLTYTTIASVSGTSSIVYDFTAPSNDSYYLTISTVTQLATGTYTLLAAAGTTTPPPNTNLCSPSTTVLCVNAARFSVTVGYTTTTGSGRATAVPLTADTGYFWFFTSGNVEVVVKVVDGRGFNNHFWVFAGGLTNVDVGITVTDMQTGQTRMYRNSQGVAFQPIQDVAAF